MHPGTVERRAVVRHVVVRVAQRPPQPVQLQRAQLVDGGPLDGFEVLGPGTQILCRAARHLVNLAPAKFVAIHSGFVGLTAEEFAAAHEADLKIQAEEGGQFERAWLDPASGKAFCLIEALLQLLC